MGKMKRNHWVPQSYLRAFAADPDRREKIWRFSKEDGDPELKPIEKVAVRHWLYVPRSDAGERDYTFEQRLSELEQWFGGDLWKSLLTEHVSLANEPIRKMVSLLAAVMYLRNPKTLDLSNTVHRQLVAFYERLPDLPGAIKQNGKTYKLDTSDWEKFRKGNAEDLKRNWISGVKQASWLAEIFMGMRWAIITTDTPRLITTDHPVSAIHPTLDFQGFNNPQTMVIFPLSPRRLLIMDHRKDEPPDQYCEAGEALSCWNAVLWRNAIEYMFCSRHPDEVLAEIEADARKAGFT